jgi:uncharacterized delta-60 repeat protein
MAVKAYDRRMATPGELDTSFAGDGKRAIDFGGVDAARAILPLGNGKIVVAGGGSAAFSMCVARLSANGTFDTTFASTGKRRIDFGGDTDEAAHAMARQADGKLVLAGDSDLLRVTVARLNPNGTLDKTFSGDGKTTFKFGSLSRATAVIVLPSRKLLFGGFSGPEGGNIHAARMNPNGTLDTSFGTAGKATVDFGGDDFGLAMARQSDGRILLAGRSTVAGAVIARLRPNGALDPDFSGDGKLTLGDGTLNAVMVQPDGKIVVAGNVGGLQRMTVTRLNPNGSPDTTFDGDGTAVIDIGPMIDQAGDALLQPDGKIVVAGSTQGGGIGVARLNPNGSPDATFGGGDGKTNVEVGAEATFGFAVARAPNGRIIVGGQTVLLEMQPGQG